MDHIGPKATEKVLFRDIWKKPGRPKTCFNRNDIHSEWLAIRNGCGTTPKGPIGPSPKDPPRPIRPLNPMCPYPNYSGAFGPATPKSPLPQGDARSAFNFLIKFWYHFRNFDFRFWTVSAGGRHVLAEGYRLKSHESP